MGTNVGMVTYFNLKTDDLQRVNVVPISNPPSQPIISLSLIRFANSNLLLSIMTPSQMFPFLLNHDFTEIPSKNPVIQSIPNAHPHKIYADKDFIGVLMGSLLLIFTLPINTTNPQLGGIYRTQHSLVLPPTATGLCAFDEFALVYDDQGNLQVFLFRKEDDAVAQFSIPGALGFEYDCDAGELYAVFPRSVRRLRFDPSGRTRGTDSIRLWLYNRFLAEKNEKAVDILSTISLPFDELLKMAGRSDEQRLQLLRNLLTRIKSQKSRSHRTVAMAVLAIDLFARVESMRAKPSPSAFKKFAEDLLADHLVDMATINRTLLEYGWEQPLKRLADEATLFNKLMERGNYDKALEQMKTMRDDETFCTSAVRIFTHKREEVAQLLLKRESVENEKLAPILMSEEARPLVFQLFTTGRLRKPWLCRVYSLAVSKDPSEVLIEPFFRDFAHSKNGDIPAMSRCLITEKQYLMLAYGLRTNKDLVGAVAVAAKGNPVSAFDVIPLNTEPELKKRCATRILRSLTRENAELVAKKLVEEYAGAGVDVPTLLQFLPDDLPIAKLDVVLAEFTKAKDIAAEEQKSRFTGSQSGIKNAQKLMDARTEKISSLSSTEPCEKCRRPFFSEPGIVYPCSHVLHLKCAEKIAKMVPLLSGDDPINITADCPFCGFLSIRLLDSPYAQRPEGSSEIDPWSTDFDRLLADEGGWKLLSALKF
jgi:hypothetical protein